MVHSVSTDIVKTGRILFFCLFVCFYLITQRSWMKPLLRNNICPWLWSIVMCVCAELIFTFDYVIARPSGHWVPPGACLNDITTLSFMCLKKIRSKKCPPFFLAPLSYATFQFSATCWTGAPCALCSVHNVGDQISQKSQYYMCPVSTVCVDSRSIRRAPAGIERINSRRTRMSWRRILKLVHHFGQMVHGTVCVPKASHWVDCGLSQCLKDIQGCWGCFLRVYIFSYYIFWPALLLALKTVGWSHFAVNCV